MNKTNHSGATEGPRFPVIDAEAASGLLAGGWAAADLHVHTLHSYDVIPTRRVDPLTLYRKARRQGMTYVAFTDHDSMDAYDRIGWTREGLVPAVEVKILDPKKVGHTIHVNVYALDRGQFREISRIAREARDIELFAAYLEDARLPFIFNHPFWHEAGETINLRAVIDVAELFPVLEYNMGRIGWINGQALRLARAKGKGLTASTDTHIGDIGRAFTVARGKTFGEFFDGIRKGESRIVPADLTLSRLKEETAIRIQGLFDKAGWLFPKESLAIDTGNAMLDAIIGRLAEEGPGAEKPRLADRILRRLLEALSDTGIPGSLYIRHQRILADRIAEVLGNVESAA
ncbi:MAG: PHP domain-containing protein [Candidatus Aminicenantales bacterium]